MAHLTRKDLWFVALIGVLVGLLIQPILSNIIPASITISMTLRFALLIGFAIFAPLALVIAALLGKFIPVLYQFAKFAAVGTLNSMIDAGVFNLLVYFTSVATGSTAILFKAISFLCATTNSFFWNKYWTFNAKNSASVEETGKFYIVAAVGWLLNVTMFTIVNGLHHSLTDKQWANVAVLCGIAVSFLWDFIGYKFLVFAEHATHETTAPPAA